MNFIYNVKGTADSYRFSETPISRKLPLTLLNDIGGHKMVIYCIENLINGRKYIGYSTKLNSEEELQKSNYWGSGILIHKKILEYGIQNFARWVILKDIFNIDELKRYEILWIKKLHSHVSEWGYNKTKGGDGVIGYKCTEEQIKLKKKIMKERWANIEYKNKMHIVMKGNNLGKKRTIEQKANQSRKAKGKHKSELAKQNMCGHWSEERRNNYGQYRIGKKHKKHAKQKHQESNIKKICKHCGTEDITKFSFKKYKCCKQCYNNAIKKYAKNRAWKNIKYKKICQICQLKFETKGASQKICNNCKNDIKRGEEKNRKIYNRKFHLICNKCNLPFLGTGSRQLHCEKCLNTL
jgi:hypothetical protein